MKNVYIRALRATILKTDSDLVYSAFAAAISDDIPATCVDSLAPGTGQSFVGCPTDDRF